MPEEIAKTWVASFRDRDMRLWEAPNGYQWNVMNSATGDLVAEGAEPTRERAMITAAEAAGADWGNALWRSPDEEAEDTEA